MESVIGRYRSRLLICAAYIRCAIPRSCRTEPIAPSRKSTDSRCALLDLSRIVSPMEQSLSLYGPAVQRAGWTIFSNLGDVATDGAPAFDLPLIVDASSSEVIATIPLKPAPRVFLIKPTLFSPDRKRLRSVYAKVVQLGIVTLCAKFSFSKPTCGKLTCAVGHVLAAKNSKPKHFFGRKFRPKSRIKTSTLRLCQEIYVTLLH